MELEQERIRGERARQLMEDPMIAEALDMIEREAVRQWEMSPARDTEGRERLWMFYVITKKFRNTLQETMDTGKMAAIQLSEKQGLAAKVANMWR